MFLNNPFNKNQVPTDIFLFSARGRCDPYLFPLISPPLKGLKYHVLSRYNVKIKGSSGSLQSDFTEYRDSKKANMAIA